MNLSNEIYASYKKPVPHSEIDPCLTMMYRFFVQLCDLRAIFTAILVKEFLRKLRENLRIKKTLTIGS